MFLNLNEIEIMNTPLQKNKTKQNLHVTVYPLLGCIRVVLSEDDCSLMNIPAYK